MSEDFEEEDGRGRDGRDARAPLFEMVCSSGDTEGIIESLEDYALRDLIGYLEELDVLSGVPGAVYGMAILEAAKRFLNL